MERPQPTLDNRHLRAARSLFRNRTQQEIARARVERAEGFLAEWLVSTGLSQAVIGLYALELQGNRVVVSKRAADGAVQLPLEIHESAPDPYRVDRASTAGLAEQNGAFAVFSEPELATIARAMLASLTEAKVAPLLARHEAGVNINGPEAAVAVLRPGMDALAHEQLRVLTLSTRHDLLGNHLVYQGTVNSAQVRVAEVMRPAVVQQAPRIIVAHNHPSGNPAPSADDHALTTQLAQGARLLGIGLMDHLIVAGDRFTSFRQQGLLDESFTVQDRYPGSTTDA